MGYVKLLYNIFNSIGRNNKHVTLHLLNTGKPLMDAKPVRQIRLMIGPSACFQDLGFFHA